VCACVCTCVYAHVCECACMCMYGVNQTCVCAYVCTCVYGVTQTHKYRCSKCNFQAAGRMLRVSQVGAYSYTVHDRMCCNVTAYNTVYTLYAYKCVYPTTYNVCTYNVYAYKCVYPTTYNVPFWPTPHLPHLNKDYAAEKYR
jgi:hypothetical protein